MSIPESMKAIVFQGPFDIATVSVPTPKLTEPTDVLLKVTYSGLCGTDLHTYRGHIKGPVGNIIGHEFMGVVVEKGSAISSFEVGDEVLSTFTIQCGSCWYCRHGYSGQCVKTNTFGKAGLPGGQAEYVRIPYAETTLIKKPSNDSTDDSVYVLMADIFTTGYYGAKKIVNHFKNESARGSVQQDISDATILQLGLGPVGLCALRALKHFGFKKIVCLDSVPQRLEEAQRLGAYKTINFQTEPDALADFIAKNTDGGIGFDAVLEVVGASQALRTAYDSVRGNGFISSIGMPHDSLPFTGLECYLKNVNISFGRCHAWSLFHEALEVFEKLKKDFESFIDCKISVDDAKHGFDIFDAHKVNKVVFDFTK
ncbi:hypothetical protein PGUG_01261 [Meyerozyma guilliermondii ATCC 6260]|uniref:Enoyl reductase (ER) domain-containing protein n=1 Tax=Meyerozyma guilliermondii (strain ATCC 6260 / CBS 566 / DSM 6381 / JCM 1539 / NBRC 10279 / NRRL Y-324) TaxID=294746 RepID=A5DDB0_PICGU|nr:uncharacterized protein PGUG_01261 [Meyerozyma guilliermondii ATCC 6260]EDK37163.2 hypothetical protein PGUG_01261 [Meyerozyma guilliermondii ATCC 6260]